MLPGSPPTGNGGTEEFSIPVEKLIGGLAVLLEARGLGAQAELVRLARPELRIAGFDNWNGGTTKWELVLHVPVDQFSPYIADEPRNSEETRLAELARLLLRGHEHVWISVRLAVDLEDDSPHPETSANTITEPTRQDIFDAVIASGMRWSGRLNDVEFLEAIFDLDALPSNDYRFKSMRQDVATHRISFPDDWSDDWVFNDPRLGLRSTTDSLFLRFLIRLVDPLIRPEPSEARTLAEVINRRLRMDGWELYQVSTFSGKPVFRARRATPVVSVDVDRERDALSDEYVRELIAKCDSKLSDGDHAGAITNARTLVEQVLSAIEIRVSSKRGDYKGELLKQMKAVTRLIALDPENPSLDERYKDVVRGLTQAVAGLATIRNSVSDSHAREHEPQPHQARLAVNAAKTVVVFLADAFQVFREEGNVPSADPASTPAGAL